VLTYKYCCTLLNILASVIRAVTNVAIHKSLEWCRDGVGLTTAGRPLQLPNGSPFGCDRRFDETDGCCPRIRFPAIRVTPVPFMICGSISAPASMASAACIRGEQCRRSLVGVRRDALERCGPGDDCHLDGSLIRVNGRQLQTTYPCLNSKLDQRATGGGGDGRF
jgi:hypothetical protein